MLDPIHIRKAKPEDVPALVGLWREMWDLHSAADPRFALAPKGQEAMAEWIGRHIEMPTSCVLAACDPTDDARPVGYVLGMVLENPPVTPDRFFGMVSEIAVRADHRRRGVGGRLLAGIQDWFRLLRVSYVEVNVSVRNPVARAFWRKKGYGEFLERLRMEITSS